MYHMLLQLYSRMLAFSSKTCYNMCMTKESKGVAASKTAAVQTAAYRTISDEQRKDFYKLLVTHNYSEAAAQIGMDAFYSGGSLRTAGYQIYKDIKEIGLDKLDISGDIIDMVEEAIESRKIRRPKTTNLPSETEFTPTDLLDPSDTKQVVVGGRNKAAMLLHKKFDALNKNKKALENTSLSQLGTVFGILFDKAQIIQGQATENISVMSKNINDKMTTEESLDAILRMREDEVASKAD